MVTTIRLEYLAGVALDSHYSDIALHVCGKCQHPSTLLASTQAERAVTGVGVLVGGASALQEACGDDNLSDDIVGNRPSSNDQHSDNDSIVHHDCGIHVEALRHGLVSGIQCDGGDAETAHGDRCEPWCSDIVHHDCGIGSPGAVDAVVDATSAPPTTSPTADI